MRDLQTRIDSVLKEKALMQEKMGETEEARKRAVKKS
jgi:hypothetical protein